MMFKLAKYLKPYWWQIIVLLASVAVQVWASLQLPALMADIVNDGIVAGNLEFVWHTGFLMVGFAILTSIGAFLSGLLSARIGSAFARDVRNDFFRQVLSFSISDISDFSTASLITRTTNDILQVQQAMIMCLSMALRAPMTCAIAIIQAVVTAPSMTWIIALAVGVILLLTTLTMAVVMPKFKILQRLLDRITMLTRENLTGLRVIRAFNNEALEQRKFEKTNRDFAHLDVVVNLILSVQDPLISLVFNGTTLLCIYIGISLITTDLAYLGNMMAFMQYAIQVVMSFLFLTMLFVILPRANVSAGRINEVLHTRPKIRWRQQTKGEPDSTPSVEFSHVDFAYDGADEKVLQDVSFVAPAGQTTAFIGSTGSGKSTLINLVPRFYEATSGEIKINGLPIKNYSEDDLMHRIGYVPQRGVLFSGTVRSNILFGAPEAGAERMRLAARVSQSEEFIMKLEHQYDSHIAQGGTNVSGGQKQRLSIARAIAKDPQIYIFDDSFSALDMKTDAKLRHALKPVTQNAVTLIVAQRISTIKDAEQIIVLNQGHVVGKGTHHELLQNCKVYREIARSQLSEAEFARELKQAQSTPPRARSSQASPARASQASPARSAKSNRKERRA